MSSRLPAGVAAWPFALTFAWTVGVFSASTAPIQDLWRPLVVALGLTIVVVGVGRLIGRGNHSTFLLVGVTWLLALGAWPIAAAIVALTIWRFLVGWMRQRRGARATNRAIAKQIINAADVLGWAGAIVATLSLILSGAVVFPADPAVGTVPTTAETPSMYVVLLDGYPATDTLRDAFAFDNGLFIAELGARGFSVPEESRANYNRTLLTMTSMLHMSYIHDIKSLANPGDSGAAQTRQLTAALNSAPVPEIYRIAGYRIIALGSTYGDAVLSSADDLRQSGALTMFEEQFLRYTALGNLLITWSPELIAEQHRQGVLRSLDGIEKLARETRDQPILALAHIFSPHTPFIFSSDGTPRPAQDCYPETCGLTDAELDRLQLSREDYGEQLAGQVEFLNGRLLEVVDTIVAQDPGAVIVLFSDHGARFEEGVNDEHFRNFLAVRTPERQDLFPTDVSLINLFPTLLNGYFDMNVRQLPSEAWWAPDFSPLEPEKVSLAMS